MRGEHCMLMLYRLYTWGSSPHARGALVVRNLELALDGIIPACAGSTRLVVHVLAHGGDHPRMRGEHRTAKVKMHVQPGSSPHARGALDVNAAHGLWVRIIPACAGSTLSWCILL